MQDGGRDDPRRAFFEATSEEGVKEGEAGGTGKQFRFFFTTAAMPCPKLDDSKY
jgi:hypothetical protein